MRRLPNPWIAVPALAAAIAGGIVGFFVTTASCVPGGCVLAASLVGAVAGIAVGVGVGVIAVLAFRSLDEFRSHRDREILTALEPDQETPGREGPPAGLSEGE